MKNDLVGVADERPLRRYRRHGTLRQMAAFAAVVRLGSVTAAAEALHMAQPTLSGLLRKLGEALDVTLFEQQGRRLVPTDAALVLLQGCDEVFEALARCEVRLAALRQPLNGNGAGPARARQPHAPHAAAPAP